MAQPFRSLIFVPGNNPRFIERAKRIVADVVCFDLEDSVPDGEKPAARKLVKEALKSRSSYASPVYVRTNSAASGKIPDDLGQVVQEGIDGIVVPKVGGAEELKKVIGDLSALEQMRGMGPVSVIPSIESAAGVVNAYRIASSSERVVAVVFGVFDLLNDMGIEYSKNPEGGRYPRAKIPVDAAAAGVASIDAIWQDLKDSKGLEEDCEIGKGLGYSGKSIIHPDQIPAAHRIFRPTKTEILWAEKVCGRYLESVRAGKGATTVDGKMIDEVHYKQARALLDAAKP